MGNQDGFDRYARATDGPLTVLALVMVPLLVLPLLVELSAGAEQGLLAADYSRHPMNRVSEEPVPIQS